MRKYTLYACWGSRAESATTSANRLLALLELMATIGEDFARWYLVEGELLVPLEGTPAERARQLSLHLERRFKQWTHAGQVFSAHTALLTNGRSRRGRVKLEARTGITTTSTGVQFLNYLLVEFYGPQPTGALSVVQGAYDLTSLVVKWSEPLWGSLRSGDRPEMSIEDRYLAKPAAGWVTYLAALPPDPQLLLGPWQIERDSRGGVYFRITDTWFDPREPSHLLPATRLQHLLASTTPSG